MIASRDNDMKLGPITKPWKCDDEKKQGSVMIKKRQWCHSNLWPIWSNLEAGF